MRTIPTPPHLVDIVPSPEPDWFVGLTKPPIREFIRRANDGYVHWHKLRYFRNLPEGFNAQLAWAAIKISRIQQYQTIPIQFNGSKLTYWNPPVHLEWLHIIDKEAGGTIGSRSIHIPSGDSERYLLNALMEEAIASSQLEGAVTTRKIAKQMLRRGSKPKTKAERMILNNYQVIQSIRGCQSDDLSPQLLKEWHSILTAKTLADPKHEGHFRTVNDHVVVADSHTNDVLYAPPAADTIDSQIEEVCDFANEKSIPFVHPVLKAIIMHFALGYIHPFVDGNGRTARALFHWFMLKQGYWLFEYLPISRLFLRAPAKYARAYLYTETDEGDATYFIHYNLRVILRAVKEFHSYLKNQQRNISEATKLLRSTPGLNHRQQALIYHALKNPDVIYTISEYKGIHGVSYGTARSDLLSLAKLKYLEVAHRGSKMIFYPHGELLTKLRQTSESLQGRAIASRKYPQPPAVTKLLTNDTSVEDVNDPQQRLFRQT